MKRRFSDVNARLLILGILVIFSYSSAKSQSRFPDKVTLSEWRSATIHLMMQEHVEIEPDFFGKVTDKLSQTYKTDSQEFFQHYIDTLRKYSQISTGTAFIIESNKFVYLATAKHVIDTQKPYEKTYIYPVGSTSKKGVVEVGKTPKIFRIPNYNEVGNVNDSLKSLFYSKDANGIKTHKTLVKSRPYKDSYLNSMNFISLDGYDFALIPLYKINYMDYDTLTIHINSKNQPSNPREIRQRTTINFLKNLKENGYKPVDLSKISNQVPSELDDIFTIGFPGLFSNLGIIPGITFPDGIFNAGTYSYPTFTKGHISNLMLSSYLCNLPVYEGNSGGPVIADNKLIGIISERNFDPNSITTFQNNKITPIPDTLGPTPFSNIVSILPLLYTLYQYEDIISRQPEWDLITRPLY